MKKAELIRAISEKMKIPLGQAEIFLDTFVATIIETLQKNEEVNIQGFGAFSTRLRSSRLGVDPRNPTERISMPTVTVPKFKAGKNLKDALKNIHNQTKNSPS